MVGYALSAASDGSYENILITVIDADDFAFADNGADTAVYHYSRRLCSAERIDKAEPAESIPYKVIYDVASMLRKEEIKWGFPMALVWSCPQFGKLELVSAEFQNIWPAVMFLEGRMECAYVNVTGAFFKKGIRPLYASFLCDILNEVLNAMGVYVSGGFCACFNSVFCDMRIFEVEKALFRTDYLVSNTEVRQIEDIRNLKYKKPKLSRQGVRNSLKKYLDGYALDSADANIRSRLIALKRLCVRNCVQVIYEHLESRSSSASVYEKLGVHISSMLKEISGMSAELCTQYIINMQTDIYYMTFDDLLSALTFADERMDLKSVIRIVRRKNAIVRKNPVPDAVLPGGVFVYKNADYNISE